MPLKNQRNTSCSFTNKYIAKAAHDQPETQKYKNPTLTQQTASQTTVKQVDMRSLHFSIQANATVLSKAGKCSQMRSSQFEKSDVSTNNMPVLTKW